MMKSLGFAFMRAIEFREKTIVENMMYEMICKKGMNITLQM